MNVTLHTITAVGIATLLTNIDDVEQSKSLKSISFTGACVFVAGVIGHGILDYLPHCYPINSKFDVIFSLMAMLLLLWFANKSFRLILGLSFLGSIFPDLIDLSLPILNKQLGINLPTFSNIFPWHWHQYSGSIYNGDCSISTINHLLVLLINGIILWLKRPTLKRLFSQFN